MTRIYLNTPRRVAEKFGCSVRDLRTVLRSCDVVPVAFADHLPLFDESDLPELRRLVNRLLARREARRSRR